MTRKEFELRSKEFYCKLVDGIEYYYTLDVNDRESLHLISRDIKTGTKADVNDHSILAKEDYEAIHERYKTLLQETRSKIIKKIKEEFCEIYFAEFVSNEFDKGQATRYRFKNFVDNKIRGLIGKDGHPDLLDKNKLNNAPLGVLLEVSK